MNTWEEKQEKVCQIMKRREEEKIPPPKKIFFGLGYKCPNCGQRIEEQKIGFGSIGSPSILFFTLFECPCGYQYARPLRGIATPGGVLKPKKEYL